MGSSPAAVRAAIQRLREKGRVAMPLRGFHFADEVGSWQDRVDWEEVLPPWFRVLSATAAPEEYAQRITALLEHHRSYGGEKTLNFALTTATPGQRQALRDAADRPRRSQRGSERA